MMFFAQKKFITIIKQFLDMKRTVFMMKRMFSSTKRVFSLMIMMLVASMTFTLVGCSDDNGRTETPLSDKYSNIPEDKTIVFEDMAGIVYPKDADGNPIAVNMDGQSIDTTITRVGVGMSARNIYLPKDHPKYDIFYKMLSEKDESRSIYRVTILKDANDDGYPIIDVSELSEEKRRTIYERYEKNRENDSALKV